MADEDLEAMSEAELSDIARVFDPRGARAREILAQRRSAPPAPSPAPKADAGATGPVRAPVRNRSSRSSATTKVIVRPATTKVIAAPDRAVSRWSFVGTMLIVGTFVSLVRRVITKIKFPRFRKNGDLSMTQAKKVAYRVLAVIAVLALASVGGKMIYDKGQRDGTSSVLVGDDTPVKVYDPSKCIDVGQGYSQQFEVPVGLCRTTGYFKVAPDTEVLAVGTTNRRLDVGFYDVPNGEITWKKGVYWVDLQRMRVPVPGDIIIFRFNDQGPGTIVVSGTKKY